MQLLSVEGDRCRWLSINKLFGDWWGRGRIEVRWSPGEQWGWNWSSRLTVLPPEGGRLGSS